MQAEGSFAEFGNVTGCGGDGGCVYVCAWCNDARRYGYASYGGDDHYYDECAVHGHGDVVYAYGYDDGCDDDGDGSREHGCYDYGDYCIDYCYNGDDDDGGYNFDSYAHDYDGWCCYFDYDYYCEY